MSANPEWWARKACHAGVLKLFYPPDNGETTTARNARVRAASALCAGCPVLVECRAWSLAVELADGFCAGMTADERHRLQAGQRRGAVQLSLLTS